MRIRRPHPHRYRPAANTTPMTGESNARERSFDGGNAAIPVIGV